jgi:hypothetical protein
MVKYQCIHQILIAGAVGGFSTPCKKIKKTCLTKVKNIPMQKKRKKDKAKNTKRERKKDGDKNVGTQHMEPTTRVESAARKG